MKSLFRVFTYIVRYPWLASGTLLCAIGATLLVIVFPSVTQRIIDDAIRGNRPELILPLSLTALTAFFGQSLLNTLRIFLNNHFEQKVIFDLRSDLYAHIQILPLRWFDKRTTGDLMTRLIEDVTNMERVLIDGIEQGTVAILQITAVLGLMAYYDIRLALAALTPMPFLLGGAILYTATARTRYQKQRRAASELNSLLQDNIAGIRQIKAYTSESREHARFNETSNKLRAATLVVMRIWALYSPSMTFLSSCGALIVVTYGGFLVLSHNLDIGVLVAFLVLTQFLYEPIDRLHQLNQLFQSGHAAADRVFEILDEPGEPIGVRSAECRVRNENNAASQLDKFASSESTTSNIQPDEVSLSFRTPHSALRTPQGSVLFDSVSFRHSGSAGASGMLENISLTAAPGETIALVGPTGAGKSTLMNLLVRFYEYDSGRILLDGKEITTLSLETLRHQIGIVTQESFLFNGSTADNLRIGKPEATEEEMWWALECANAIDFVKRLPKQLNTPLGERGVRLSVGEKQRLSIARALLKDPPVLILDEATASVDTATETMIQQALSRLMEKRTSFVIAHRLSTIQYADQILVMERGRIIERGTHESLLRMNGLYAKLCHQATLSSEILHLETN